MESIPFVGELASLLAALIWAVSLTFFTAFSRDLKPDQMNLYKHVVAMGCLTISLIFLSPVWPSTLETYGAFFLSGIIGLAIGDTALFAALKRMGAQNTSVSQCSVPPLTAILAFLFLRA